MINEKYGLNITIELNKDVMKLLNENKDDIILNDRGDNYGTLYNND